MIRPSILALGLLAGSAAASLQAQTHLGVSAKDMTTIQVNLVDDGTCTLTKLWTEKRFGTATTVTADTYTPSKKETLVITDAEFTVYCSAASPSARKRLISTCEASFPERISFRATSRFGLVCRAWYTTRGAGAPGHAPGVTDAPAG